MEDHMNSIRSEWHAMKEKWFHGETIDPVFEGVVRDFCAFDESMHGIQTKVSEFMKGVEQLAIGMTALSDGVSTHLSQTADHQIASDSCKLKEATNQIARADAPHSAISKLRRDMTFNVMNPVQSHIANNRNLKVSLGIRRQRLVEFTSAKKQFEECTKKNLSKTDRKYLQAQSNFEAAKSTFSDVDRHVFEWLYILEEYRGDILDSTLQTLKYLQYEFFATSAHTISVSLPSRMEFRPMVEMTPDHLEVQVDMELQDTEEPVVEGCEGGPGAIVDFSLRLIEKKAKDDPDEHAAPAVPVDPLSLSSLLSQGFDEGPARRALRLHNNNTQAALDWLIDGGTEETAAVKKVKAMEDGVRMPTTVKRVQKLKAMRNKWRDRDTEIQAKQEARHKERPSSRRDRDSSEERGSRSPASREDREEDTRQGRAEIRKAERQRSPPRKKQEVAADLLDMDEAPAAASSVRPSQDLLGFDSEEPAVPTDFTQPLTMAPLPQMDLLFDGGARCEKPPLPTSVAAGIALPRAAEPVHQQGLLELSGPAAPAAAGDALAGFSPELLAQVQALASQSQISPQQLLLAAAAQQQQALPPAAPAATLYNSPSLAAPQTFTGSAASHAASTGLEALDPFEGLSASPQASPPPAAATGSGYSVAPGKPGGGSGGAEPDQFSSLMGLMAPNS